MKRLSFDSLCYRLDGRPCHLYSGEFHYFRVPRKDWRTRLRLLRETGGNCVATYIPWLLHEPQEGVFRFSGADPLELEAFLETAADEGLHVLARPGPYQYSELAYAGLPGWLCEGYPHLRARHIDGTPFGVMSVSYVHPLFLDKVERWFAQVAPILARHDATRGGPIAFVQFDNELIGIHTWFGGLDYNRESMGFGKPDGRFPRFLAERYGHDIARLNAAYGSTHAAFHDVEPAQASATSGVAELRRARDYWDFYRAMIGEYAAILARLLRGHGIAVPLVHNSANPDMNAMFDGVLAAVPPPFLLGSDHYYNLNQSWRQNNPTPQYAVDVFCSNEMLRLRGFPPTVFELPGGSCSDWPPITATDSLACTMANLALGMKGHNLYIFTGGPNVPGTGSTGAIYDYGAGIGAFGEVRPLYHAQKRVGRFLARHRWLAEAQAETDVRVLVDFEGSISGRHWPGKCGFALSAEQVWDFTKKGALTTAFCAGLLPALIAADDDGWVADSATPVIVPLSAALSAAAQRRVVDFLEAGGQVLAGPVLPTVDMAFTPCTILRDRLGAADVTPHAGEVRLSIAGVPDVFPSGEVFASAPPPGGTVLGTDAMSGKVVAWTLPVGRGRIVFLGLRWLHARREHEQVLVRLLERLGLERRVHCSNPNVWCTLRTAGTRSLLFMMNLLTSPQEADVAFRPTWSETWLKTGPRHLPAMSVRTVAAVAR